MNVYFISGLGADKRVFRNLVLPPKYKIHHVEWISPVNKESLPSYAKRLLAQIDSTQPFVRIGLSFGGIVSVELSKIIKPEKVILISSIQTGKEVPWYFKVAGALRLHALLPSKLLKSANRLTFWLFGMKTQEEKELLKQILHDTDAYFLKWAISKITAWDNSEKGNKLFHIHGSSDKLLPLKFTKPDHIIKDGGHLMVYDKHIEISRLIGYALPVQLKS